MRPYTTLLISRQALVTGCAGVELSDTGPIWIAAWIVAAGPPFQWGLRLLPGRLSVRRDVGASVFSSGRNFALRHVLLCGNRNEGRAVILFVWLTEVYLGVCLES